MRLNDNEDELAEHEATHISDDGKDAKMAAIDKMKKHVGVEDDEEDTADAESNSELQSPGYSMKYKRKKKGGGGGMGGMMGGGGMGGMDMSSMGGMMG